MTHKTDWENSKIEREPSVAEIVEAFAANPPNFDDLINSVANAQTLAEAQAEMQRLRAEVDNRKAAHESTADSFARILAALDHASPASIVHHLNGEGACLQMINDMRYRIEQVTAENERLDQCIGELRLELSKCQERNDELCIANHNQTVKISKIRKVINEN